jgi:sarcosine oxidase, subunit beta
MSATADVVVIGGGLHGLATALHLALRGIKAIVIEKDYAGRHASGVNAGGVRTLARHISEVPLSLAAMEIWSNIRQLVDDDCGLVSDGQVLIAEDEAEFAAMRGRVEALRLKGFTHEELIGREELRSLVSCVAGHCRGGVVSRRDGAADPFRTTHAFRRKAEALGQRVVEGVAVGDLSRRGSSWHLATTQGAFEAPIIVNAAGAWADRIAASLGEPVPLEAVALMLMITVPMAAWIKPVVILRGRKLSFKQLASGAVLIGGGHAGRVNRDENRTELDWQKLAESARTVAELFPLMRETRILRAWAGIEARTPDELPVIGRSARHQGVYHQFGFSGHGFQLAPGVGALMAELIATGRSNLAIAPFDIARFSGEHITPAPRSSTAPQVLG